MNTKDGLRVEPSTGGIPRRELIRRAAIAGVAAWTVPVVIESLTSPAGALTIAPGCTRMWVVFSSPGGSWPAWRTTVPNGCSPSGSCTPTNSTAAAAAVSISPATQPANNSTTPVSITIPNEGNCTVVGASAYVVRSGANVCVTATSSTVTSGVQFAFAARGVTITPQGATGGSTFWDNSGGTRSSIGVVISCT